MMKLSLSPRFRLLVLCLPLLVGCDNGATQPIVISRPDHTAMPTVAPTDTAPPRIPPTASPLPLPSPTPTLSPELAEYNAVAAYALANRTAMDQVTEPYNNYMSVVKPLEDIVDYRKHISEVIPVSDALVSALDQATATLQATTPPPRAQALHEATLAYLQEQRAYVSDLRQGAEHDNTDLWDRGVNRYDKVNELNDTRKVERDKLNDYLKTGRAK